MAEVSVPIRTKYDGAGFDRLQRDAQRAERELLRQTRAQIAQHRRVANLTKRLDRDLEQSAKRRRSLMESITGGVLTARGIEMGARALADFTVQSIAAADRATAVERSFVNLSGGAARAAANMAAMERATRNLISETDQQAIANQLLGMRIVDTADKLEKLVSGSRRLGKEFRGMGAAEAANEFALLLSNMSYQRLDQFGLSAGKVRQRVNELKDAGMGAEEAFKTAVFEEMDTTLQRLGPEVSTAADSVDKLSARWAEFQVAVGRAITPSTQGLNDLSAALEWLTDRTEQAADGWSKFLEYTDIAVIGLHNLVIEGQSLGEAFTNAGQEVDATRQAFEETAVVTNQATIAEQEHVDVLEQANRVLEDHLERLDRVNEIRRDAARELIEIEERAAEELEDLWSEYWDRQEDEWQDHSKRIADIQKKAAKEAAKAQADLQKDLAKVDADTNKKIADLTERHAKEQQREERRRRIDHLADERLFNLELQHLAAEGQGNAIREAIERRAIEQQIEAEKAAEEKRIADEDFEEEKRRIKDAAEERKQELENEAAEEAELREQRLAEDLAAEEENYAERMIKLREWREEKLAEIEASRIEAVEELGRELAEMGDLTEEELKALIPMAGKLGEDVGEAIADGIAKGFETNNQIQDMLGGLAPVTSGGSSGGGGGSGGGGIFPFPIEIPAFQAGGVVPGPIGAATMALVHGGETVSPPGRSAQSFNITVNASGGVSPQRVEIMLQQFVDEVLVPALS